MISIFPKFKFDSSRFVSNKRELSPDNRLMTAVMTANWTVSSVVTAVKNYSCWLQIWGRKKIGLTMVNISNSYFDSICIEANYVKFFFKLSKFDLY